MRPCKIVRTNQTQYGGCIATNRERIGAVVHTLRVLLCCEKGMAATRLVSFCALYRTDFGSAGRNRFVWAVQSTSVVVWKMEMRGEHGSTVARSTQHVRFS